MDKCRISIIIPVYNAEEYLDRCINAFMYNASLASPKERLAFHLSRNLPDTMRCRLFNDIANKFFRHINITKLHGL